MQLPLESAARNKAPAFDGATYSPERDGGRLAHQSKAVWNFMKDGHWATLPEIAEALGYPEASISARLRDFRKPKFGSHEVQRSYLRDGLWEYRVVPSNQGLESGEHRS